MQKKKRQNEFYTLAIAESPNSILLATDVAARGLDIKNIQHVVHYQVPRTAEVKIVRFFQQISILLLILFEDLRASQWSHGESEPGRNKYYVG